MCAQNNDDELRCKVCDKLASEDSHFYKKKMLCNRHYLQMYRHGKILSEEEMYHTYDKVCDICGDKESNRYVMWSNDDEYKGVVLCGKHYAQLRNNGKVIDKYPASHIPKEERKCDVCGSNNGVKYHNGSYYCLRHYSQIKNLGGLMERTIFDKNDYIINGDITTIILRNKKFEETGRTIIDTEDLDRVIKYKWRLNSWGYADSEYGMMQRIILSECKSNQIVDHINRDTLDNRKSNLRIVNKSINAVNSDIRPNNTSGVIGVSWNKNAKSWRAYINYSGKRLELGHRKDFKDAVVLRLNAENKYYAGMQPQKHLFEEYGVELYE